MIQAQSEMAQSQNVFVGSNDIVLLLKAEMQRWKKVNGWTLLILLSMAFTQPNYGQ